MPLASVSGARMRTTLSTWTPLNHPQTNSKVFEERRNLLSKWFAGWSDSQRRAVLQDFALSCSPEQLAALSLIVSRRLPLLATDFTCLLPRALSLYLFSFLDPRSLCRCARVSWRWKSIVELDQLWVPKCVRLGWCINFSPTPFEQGVWKRHYTQTVQELRLTSLQPASSQQQLGVPRVSAAGNRREDPPEVVFLGEERPASGGISGKKRPPAPPPWRDADRRPKDTLRFNYLDNVDPSEQAPGAQTKSRAPSCRTNARKPDDGGRKTLSDASYKLRKAKSLMFLSSNCRAQPPPTLPPPPPPLPPHHRETESRPSWAARSHHYPVAKETAKSALRLARWNAGIRPGPARPAVPRMSAEALRASQRSHRSAPSTPLFEPQPWSEARRPLQGDVRTAASGQHAELQRFSEAVV